MKKFFDVIIWGYVSIMRISISLIIVPILFIFENRMSNLIFTSSLIILIIISFLMLIRGIKLIKNDLTKF